MHVVAHVGGSVLRGITVSDAFFTLQIFNGMRQPAGEHLPPPVAAACARAMAPGSGIPDSAR